MRKGFGFIPFYVMLEHLRIPLPEPEYHFAPPRKWRFDYAWPRLKIALEVEGGVWIRGRHTRGAGFLKDIEKYNTAASLGWLVLRTIPDDLYSDATLDLLQCTMKQRAA